MLKKLFAFSIYQKVFWSFTVVLAVSALMTVGAFVYFSEIKEINSSITPHAKNTDHLQSVALSIELLDADIERFLAVGGGGIYRDDVADDLNDITLSITLLKGALGTEFELEIRQLEVLVSKLIPNVEIVMDLVESGTTRGVNNLLLTVFSNIDEAKLVHKSIAGSVNAQFSERVFQQASIVDTAINQFRILELILITLGLIGAFLLSSMITRPIRKLQRVANELAGGYYETRFIGDRSDEIGELGHAFNNMAKKLGQTHQTLEKEVKERTKELRLTNVHIETILENLSSGLVEFDDSFKVARINKTAEDFLGIKREQVIGQEIKTSDIVNTKLSSLASILYPGLAKDVQKLSHERTGLKVDVHEIKIRYPYQRDLRIITAPVIVGGTNEYLGFVKVIQDVSREKLIAKSKSDFISIAAHQLRTPLSAIRWSISLLLHKDFGALKDNQEKVLNRTYETNNKIIILVNDLLNVARIEDGKFGYQMKRSSIDEVVDSIIFNSKVRAQQEGVTIKYNKPDKKIPDFTFDTEKISLAIQNLVDNAIKYTEAGGLINVTTRVLPDSYFFFEIEDTGLGIPQSDMKQLFTRFFRAENVMTTTEQGSGLGLYIVKNIIERHGGKVGVTSEEGKGSTFAFKISMDDSRIKKRQ